MDAPEGDMFAIQSDAVDPLPLYVEYENGQTGLQDLLAALSTTYRASGLHQNTLNAFVESQGKAETGPKKSGPPEPIHQYPIVPISRKPPDDLTRVRQTIVRGFFNAISSEQDEAIALFINNNLVTANTTMEGGKTPLLAAVATKNVRIVKQLLDYGAEPDAFGVEVTRTPYYLSTHWLTDCFPRQRKELQYDFGYTDIKRTPLQLAASIGHLQLVKLLLETYHCDDSQIAPDGQIALRLAAENGHREVVAYLPSRRGGGFLRWKTQHQKAIRRAKRALSKVIRVGKFFVWDVPKFIIWSVPKHLVVEPLAKGCRWCWENRKNFGPWCRHQAQQVPVRLARFGRWLWKGVQKVPGAAKDAGKAVWKFGTETLPRWLRRKALWVWSLLTKRIPKAVVIIAKWMWAGLSSIGKAFWDVILKAVSLLHTVFEAVITFLRNLTLKDIWDGFCHLLRAIFVNFPKTIWSWILQFGETSLKFMKIVFGTAGEITWWIIVGIGWLILYVPKKLWVVLQSFGGSFGKAWYEVLVFVKPKA
jgi:hypothetical protein